VDVNASQGTEGKRKNYARFRQLISVLVSRNVPIRLWVLAPFHPRWSLLKLWVAPFQPRCRHPNRARCAPSIKGRHQWETPKVVGITWDTNALNVARPSHFVTAFCTSKATYVVTVSTKRTMTTIDASAASVGGIFQVRF
jgi:hypothetical protein